MVDWTEKYRPRALAEVLGNSKAIQSLESWAHAWERGTPKKRAVILSGRPGCGKTTAAHALAEDMGWGVIELNASDKRNAEAISRVATAGALNQTFTDGGDFLRSGEGGRKLIILDEADNVHGTHDRGGIRAILDTIRHTQQPIVLIVNDLYGLTRHSSSFKSLCQTLKFSPIQTRTIKVALRRIAAAERVEVEESTLEAIAQRTAGDLRSAINDLQALVEGRTYLSIDDVGAVGRRDNRTTMYDAVRTILKADSTLAARRAARELDEAPDFLLLWLNENVPHEYKEIPDLARAMDALARADLFLARAKRTQNYRLWAYATDLMTAGVATAKDAQYRRYTQYRFPLWLSTMGRTRGLRLTINSLSLKLASHCHTSKAIAREAMIPHYRNMFRLSGEFAISQTHGLELEEAEVALLLGEERGSAMVKKLIEAAESRDTGRAHIDPFALTGSLYKDDEEPEEEGEPPASAEVEEKDSQKSILEF
jgi:replication factor C large subunit